MAWLGRPRTKLPRVERLPDPVHRPVPAAIAAEPPRSIISIVPEAEPARPEEASAAPVRDNTWELRDMAAAITERYPLLRNTL